MTSGNQASRSTPTGNNGGVDKQRLTDAEKKQNHIISEQKRRQAIRQGFDRLASITPKMTGMGRSEATVLSHATEEMKLQLAMKAIIKRKVFAENPQMTEEFYESLYEVTQTPSLPASASPQVNSPSMSIGSGSKGKAKQKAKKDDDN
jgi:heteromeric Ino2p/Ino4p transcription factor